MTKVVKLSLFAVTNGIASDRRWIRPGRNRNVTRLTWRSFRICSSNNAALNLRGALLDTIYQAKAGRQFLPLSLPPRPEALTPSA
jgi:hypothetical protein